ncbi:hypothetical protein K469DRAFT_731106 [Zopfia rhizophila CBS 207.26]|uniref:SAP domain-containing protein n=1 Tax=Zopfia rhizophila CBS 207.26 TaxID=1314779 RepID=A0A6A6EMV6_9PEZI|nr:hypothetical protein K469DRAFT_731106 [Zopfia rhizophila CBS 207.26]
MPDYAKMKNAELETILKSRGLPTGGKKADMVERLNKDDESKKAAEPPVATVTNAEDEIDWDDDAPEPAKPATETSVSAATAEVTTEAAATTIKAGGKGPVANPQGVPNQVADVDPSKTADLSIKAPDEAETANGETKAEEQKAEEASVSFSRGLAASKLDEEIEKRKARAKKFGLNIEEDQGLKNLERMKKFGETGPPKGLDEALPERGRKRGREGDDDGGRNKRRGGRLGGRRGRRNRDGGKRRDDGREQRDSQTRNWMSETEKAKAEARKNRFAAPAAST